MAVTIVDLNSEKFSINGIEYLKHFQSLVDNNDVKILNVYDSKVVLQEPKNYAEYTVNGSTYASAILLQSALIEVLYNRFNVKLPNGLVTQNLNEKSYLVSGAIRNNGTKANDFEHWKVISTSGHYPQGFKNITGDFSDVVETLDDRIRIHHNIGGDGTGAIIAVLDETLAQTGLRLGTSVGHLYSDIYLYRDIIGQISNSGGVWNVTNSSGIKTAIWNVAGYLELTHSEIINPQTQINQLGTVDLGEWQAQLSVLTSTTSRIYFTPTRPLRHTARIRSNGSVFSIVGTSENISIGTFASNSLPIVFTDGDVNTYDIQVTAGAGLNGLGYLPQISAPSSTGFNLQFINTTTGGFAGAIDNKMEAFVSARSRTISLQPPTGTSFVLRMNSRSQINPKSLDTIEYPSGNIWVFGNVVKI